MEIKSKKWRQFLIGWQYLPDDLWVIFDLLECLVPIKKTDNEKDFLDWLIRIYVNKHLTAYDCHVILRMYCEIRNKMAIFNCLRYELSETIESNG